MTRVEEETDLSSDLPQVQRQHVFFPLAMPSPGSEVSKFSLQRNREDQLKLTRNERKTERCSSHIVSIVGHPHLGSNEQDLPVVEDDSNVVDHVLVSHGPADDARAESAGGGGRERKVGERREISHSDVANDVLSDFGVDDLS